MSAAIQQHRPPSPRAAAHDRLPGRIVPTPEVQSPRGDAVPVPTSRLLARVGLLHLVSRVRAWMLVVPVDAALLMAPVLWHPQQFKAVVSLTALSLLLLSSQGRYRARLHLSVLDEFPAVVSKLLTAAAVVATVIALRNEHHAVTVFLVNAAISLGLVMVARGVITKLTLWSRRRRLTVHRTVLIGGGPLAEQLARVLSHHPRYGLSVVGFVDDAPACAAESVVARLGGPRDLGRVVQETRADVLLIADGDFSERELHDMVRSPACLPCDLLVVPRMHHFHTRTGARDHIGSIPVMRISKPNLVGPGWALKRVFDIVVSGLLLLFFAPLMAVCALAVRLEGGPGVIFRQTRVGRNGEPFELLKFRSLRPSDSAEQETRWSIAQDSRVGPVGRFLRRTSLDELPQLWNILRGDMTLVGPRPERPHFVEQFARTHDRYAHRHRVKAGLTGFAQVNGLRGDTSIADRARHDNYYIENWSLWLDLKILLRTFSEVVFGRGG